MGCVHFSHFIPRRPVCFRLSSDYPNTCAASVAYVVQQGKELCIPSTVVPIGSKSQPWFDTCCKLATSGNSEARQIWVEALRIHRRKPQRGCITELLGTLSGELTQPRAKLSISTLGLRVMPILRSESRELESKAKLASKKLGVTNRARQYFRSEGPGPVRFIRHSSESF